MIEGQPNSQNYYQVFIKNKNRQALKLKLSNQSKLKHIQFLVQQKFKIKIPNQILIHQGSIIKNQDQFKALHFNHNSVIHAVDYLNIKETMVLYLRSINNEDITMISINKQDKIGDTIWKHFQNNNYNFLYCSKLLKKCLTFAEQHVQNQSVVYISCSQSTSNNHQNQLKKRVKFNIKQQQSGQSQHFSKQDKPHQTQSLEINHNNQKRSIFFQDNASISSILADQFHNPQVKKTSQNTQGFQSAIIGFNNHSTSQNNDNNRSDHSRQSLSSLNFQARAPQLLLANLSTGYANQQILQVTQNNQTSYEESIISKKPSIKQPILAIAQIQSGETDEDVIYSDAHCFQKNNSSQIKNQITINNLSLSHKQSQKNKFPQTILYIQSKPKFQTPPESLKSQKNQQIITTPHFSFFGQNSPNFTHEFMHPERHNLGSQFQDFQNLFMKASRQFQLKEEDKQKNIQIVESQQIKDQMKSSSKTQKPTSKFMASAKKQKKTQQQAFEQIQARKSNISNIDQLCQLCTPESVSQQNKSVNFEKKALAWNKATKAKKQQHTNHMQTSLNKRMNVVFEQKLKTKQEFKQNKKRQSVLQMLRKSVNSDIISLRQSELQDKLIIGQFVYMSTIKVIDPLQIFNVLYDNEIHQIKD